MQRKREESQHGREHRNQHGTQAKDSGVDHGILKIVAGDVAFFDEIEHHNGMADDHSDQAGHAQKRHEAEGFVHDPKRGERSHHAVWRRRQHQDWLDRILELEDQRQENCETSRPALPAPDW